MTDSFFTEEPFTTEDGFSVAFALSAYDSETEFIEDPDYGTLKAYHYEWGFEASQGSRWREIETRSCTEEDLYLNEDEEGSDEDSKSKMYSLHEKGKFSVAYYKNKFRCTDEDISVIGDYNSDKARQFVIQFEKCDNKTRSTCKSEEEIVKFLMEKYILILQNNLRFDTEKHSEESVVIKESRLIWHPISSQIRQIIPNSIQVVDLAL